MGAFLLVCRLVARDIRRHLAQAVLLVVAIAATSATLTMALALSGVTAQPYQQTRAATKAPDVIAYMTAPTQGATLVHAKGVTAHSGPFPIVSAVLHLNGRSSGVFAEGRNQAAGAVDQPEVLSGTWVRSGGIVLERTFADALDASVGDRVTLDDRHFTVAGIAVTAAQAPYPNLCYFTTNTCADYTTVGQGPRNVGLIWMTEADAIGLTSAATPPSDYALELKLGDPNAALSFALAHTKNFSSPAPVAHRGPVGRSGLPATGPPSAFTAPVFSTWTGVATADALLVTDAQSVLAPGAVLLALLAIASVAVLVGRRLSEYTRRVGLLKAVGGTPALIAGTFLFENLTLALLAAGLGLLVGWAVAPALTNPGAALIGVPGAPSLTPVHVVIVLGAAILVSLVATLIPAIRAGRTSTILALADTPHMVKRRGSLIRISRRLPVSMLFGLRLVGRRPRRALLSAASMAVTMTGLVTVIAFHTSVAAKVSGAASSGLTSGGLSDPVINRDEQMLAVITIMLVTLATLNAIFTSWATVIDARRAAALMRALGARVRQVSAGLAVAQVLSALPGVILGVPLGFLLFKAAVKGDGVAPSALWVIVAIVGTLATVAALTLIPARVGVRQSVTEALQSE